MGPKVAGEALVASDGFSARYDLDRIAGVFSRPSHALYGQSYVGKILVLDKAKGGVASAWMLHEMVAEAKAPLALVLNHVNPVIAQGAALAGLTLVVPGDPDASYLLDKLNDTQLDADVGGAGTVMPPGAMLGMGDLDAVSAWIADGAEP